MKLNKMDGVEKVGLAAIIFLLFLLVGVYFIDLQEDEACERLGFENYVFNNNFGFCEDSEGNLYTVKQINCNWAGLACDFKEISIGRVFE